jgi:hypothetical protein
MKTSARFVAIVALLLAAPALAGVTGTVGRKGTVIKVVDAFAYEGTDFFGDEKNIRLRLAAKPLDHKALAGALDYERELDRQLDGVDHVELAFAMNGAWNGGGAFYIRGATCGWCQNGAQSEKAQTRVEGGALKGTIKAKASDDDEGDGADANLVLDIPVAKHVGIANLPAGGGDPGKAFVACSKAMASKDEAAILASCFAPDDAWVKDQNLDYFNGPEFAEHAGQWYQGLLLRDVKIDGGRMKGDQAEIAVHGTITRQYGQDEPPTVEKYKGNVYLRRATTGWRFTGQQLESDN